MKTHKVVDMVYHGDELNEVMVGTQQECLDFISEQDDHFTYEMRSLTRQELITHNPGMFNAHDAKANACSRD